MWLTRSSQRSTMLKRFLTTMEAPIEQPAPSFSEMKGVIAESSSAMPRPDRRFLRVRKHQMVAVVLMTILIVGYKYCTPDFICPGSLLPSNSAKSAPHFRILLFVQIRCSVSTSDKPANQISYYADRRHTAYPLMSSYRGSHSLCYQCPYCNILPRHHFQRG